MTGFTFDTSDFEQALTAHLNTVAGKVMDEVVAAAYEVRNEAAKRTPVDTGALRAGWQVRVDRTTSGGTVDVFNNTKYVTAVEYGTAAHTITAKNKRVLADKNGAVFGSTVNHPGTRPRPMIRPAIEAVVPKLENRLKGLQ